MKATLTFDLREDQHAFDCAVNGNKYHDVIWEIQQHLRSLEKYQDLTAEQYEIVVLTRYLILSSGRIIAAPCDSHASKETYPVPRLQHPPSLHSTQVECDEDTHGSTQ
jgi:hypothetical protein